jgi:hypothetical protein
MVEHVSAVHNMYVRLYAETQIIQELVSLLIRIVDELKSTYIRRIVKLPALQLELPYVDVSARPFLHTGCQLMVIYPANVMY